MPYLWWEFGEWLSHAWIPMGIGLVIGLVISAIIESVL